VAVDKKNVGAYDPEGKGVLESSPRSISGGTGGNSTSDMKISRSKEVYILNEHVDIVRNKLARLERLP
jgi:hypothetical protein